MSHEQLEQNESHGNAYQNNTNKGTCLIERDNLWNDTMILVKKEEEQGESYFVAIGDVRLTEPTPTKEEAIANVNLQDWKFLATFITAICKLYHTKIDNK